MTSSSRLYGVRWVMRLLTPRRRPSTLKFFFQHNSEEFTPLPPGCRASYDAAMVKGTTADEADNSVADARYAVSIGKMRPPRQRISTSKRTNLIDRLDNSLGAVLTIAQSPAGFGKTVLLGQWFEELRERTDVIVGWLGLDEDDGEVTRFLANLASTLEAAGVKVSPAVTSQAQSFSEVAHRREALCVAIDQTPEMVVLILDDYHRAASAEVDAVLDHLVRNIGSGFHLVISTRDPPPLRVADLEANGLVARICAADLALSLDETAAIFAGQVDADTLALLHARTEGWAVALQLAKLWLNGDVARNNQLAAFSGRTETIARYLLEQVSNDLEPWLHDFLVETSILETFDTDTADAIRGRKDAGQALIRLASFDALLVPLDASRTWFRYHHIFAEFLRDALMLQSPGRARELHRKAADVFAETGDVQLAVKHSCRAGDLARAVLLIDQAGSWELVLRRGIGFARGLLGQFDDNFIEQQPVLLRMQGYLHMKYGALEEARRCIDRASSLTSDATGRRDGMIIDALLRTYSDNVQDDAWVAELENDVAILPANDEVGRGTLRAALAVSALDRGDLEQAEQESRAGITAMIAARSALGEAYCRFHLAQSQFYRGCISEAETGLRAVLVAVEEGHGADWALKAIGNGLLGNLLYWRNEPGEAGARLQSALPAIEAHDSWVDVLGAAYHAGISLARQRGEFTAATGLLDRIDEVARGRSLPQLVALARAWRIETLIAIGNLDAAERAALAIADHSAWRVKTATGIALSQLHLRGGRSADALRILRACRATSAKQGRTLDVARLDGLLAMTFRQRGEQENMMNAANDALSNPVASLAPRALLGLVVDFEPTLNAVLQGANGSMLSEEARFAARRLRGHLSAVAPKPDTTLSSRETAVLTELCIGRSNKDIGRRLDLTENTIKFHLKHIYEKLGTHTRSGAVTVGLQRGLVRID